MENGSVSERIAHMVEHFHKGNKSAFAKAVGISNQSLGEIVGARQSAPSFAALQKMLTAFPEVRMEWLVMGKGEMLPPKPSESGDPFANAFTADNSAPGRVGGLSFLPPVLENDYIKKDMDLLAKAMEALLSSDKSEEAKVAKDILAGYWLTEKEEDEPEWKHEAREAEAAEWRRQIQERQEREQKGGQQ